MHAFTKRLRGYGRFGDKLLAHLSPKEARILKKAGGAGTINPFTGALEYYKGTLGGRGVNPFAGEETTSDTASTESLPSWLTPPPPGSIVSQGFVTHTNPLTGETYTTPTGGYSVNVGDQAGSVNQPSTMSTEKPQAKDAFLNLANTWESNKAKEADKGLDPRMLNFAKIMQHTFDRDDPGTDGELRAEYYEGSKSIENMLKYTQGISYPLYSKLIDRGVDDQWNEDKAPGRVDEVMSYMFTKNDDGVSAFEVTGGQEALMKAYDQLGVTGEGDSYADKHVNALKKLGETLAKEFGTGQTSTTMGEVKGPQFAGEFTGPTAWSDYLDAVTYALQYQLPFSPTMKGMQAKEISERLKIPFTQALNLAMGMPQHHGLGGVGVVGLGPHNYGSSPMRDDDRGNNQFGV